MDLDGKNLAYQHPVPVFKRLLIRLCETFWYSVFSLCLDFSFVYFYAKEVMFSSALGWFVSKITQKEQNRWPRNLEWGCCLYMPGENTFNSSADSKSGGKSRISIHFLYQNLHWFVRKEFMFKGLCASWCRSKVFLLLSLFLFLS